MPAKSPSPLLLIVLLIALLVVPTMAAEMIDETVDGDKHIITIYDEKPVTDSLMKNVIFISFTASSSIAAAMYCGMNTNTGGGRR